MEKIRLISLTGASTHKYLDVSGWPTYITVDGRYYKFLSSFYVDDVCYKEIFVKQC